MAGMDLGHVPLDGRERVAVGRWPLVDASGFDSTLLSNRVAPDLRNPIVVEYVGTGARAAQRVITTPVAS
jgi:hypothetical protein